MKSRITVKEIDELCPSFDKPLTLKTDKKRAYERYKTIKIISPSVNNSFSAICSYGELRIIGAEDLLLYPSLKPEEPKFKEVVMYQAIAKRNAQYSQLSNKVFFSQKDALEDVVINFGQQLEIIGYNPVTVYLKEGEE